MVQESFNSQYSHMSIPTNKKLNVVIVIALILQFIFPLFKLSTIHAKNSSLFINEQTTVGEVIVKYKSTSPLYSTFSVRSVFGIESKRHVETTEGDFYVVKDLLKPTEKLLDEYAQKDEVEYVEPNYKFQIFAEPEDDVGEISDPNDTFFDLQWSLDNDEQLSGIPGYDIQSKEAWQLHDRISTDTGMVIGIVDTGIDYNHPDLRDSIWLNPGEFPSSKFIDLDSDLNGKITFTELTSYPTTPLGDFNDDGEITLEDLLSNNINPTIAYSNVFLDGVDDDDTDSNPSTFVDDFFGWDFENDDNDPFDDNSHGTHVSGIIAAQRNNSIGIAGLYSSAQIMPIKVFDSSGNGSLSNIIEGLDYALIHDVPIINNSWGITLPPSSAPQSLLDIITLLDANGSLFVAAAGNGHFNDGIGFDMDNDPTGYSIYPAAYTTNNILTVSSTTPSSVRSNFSNWGTVSVDIFAPGSSIYSTLPGSSYGYKSGTSMATPLIAASAGLIWQYLEMYKGQNPSVYSIKNRIITYSKYNDNLLDLSVYDDQNTNGKDLDLLGITPPSLSVSYDPPSEAGDVVFGDTVQINITSDKQGNIEGLTGSGTDFSALVSNNGRYTYDFSDQAGNIESIAAPVDWILKLDIEDDELHAYVNSSTEEVYGPIRGTCYRDAQVELSLLESGAVFPYLTEVIPCETAEWTSNSFDLSSVNDGVIVIRSEQPSAIGVPAGTVEVIKDTISPDAPVVESPISGSVTTSTSVPISGTIEEGATVIISGDIEDTIFVESNNGTFSTNITIESGATSVISLRSEDMAGNTSTGTTFITLIHSVSSPSGGGGGSGGGSSSSSTTTMFISEDIPIFQDIGMSVFEQYIIELYNSGVISGYDDGTFRPSENITRGQIAKLVVYGFGFNIITIGSGFSDVEEESSLFAYIQTLKNLGISQGFSDGTYRPNDFITRGEAVQLIVKALAIQGFDVSGYSNEKQFPDVKPENSFYESIQFLANQSNSTETIISGYSNGMFLPEENIERGAISKIIWNSMLLYRETSL
ncbi:S8 family serine peptidase [Candidatus Dojkabacteria bacterium]|uniref:S8 family serine peptidase n=1 Tax=Candidatus Dojkabacteria bacterium TaxID=2099670 RepID=A0A955L8Y6_9BACT|nr:S8 family serine peptidase [Candidatus Dojkabacteria bacterium]